MQTTTGNDICEVLIAHYEQTGDLHHRLASIAPGQFDEILDGIDQERYPLLCKKIKDYAALYA